MVAPTLLTGSSGTQPNGEEARMVSSCVGLEAGEKSELENLWCRIPTTGETWAGFSFSAQVIYGTVTSTP